MNSSLTYFFEMRPVSTQASLAVGQMEKPSWLQRLKKKVKKLVRIRLQVVPDCSARILEQSVKANVTLGSAVKTAGWMGHNFLDESSYIHDQVVVSHIGEKESVLSRSSFDSLLFKRLIISTFQGRFDPKHLQSYLDEHVFRFKPKNFQKHWEKVHADRSTGKRVKNKNIRTN